MTKMQTFLRVFCTATADDCNWKVYVAVQAVNQGHFSAE